MILFAPCSDLRRKTSQLKPLRLNCKGIVTYCVIGYHRFLMRNTTPMPIRAVLIQVPFGRKE